jgi:2-oxoglutarate ferredoxin oxidoreductase subunit beta
VFNDGAFEVFTDKKTKAANTIFLEEGKPLVFDGGSKGIRLDGLKPEIVDLGASYSENDLMLHDPTDATKAYILGRMFDAEWPRPFGVFYREDRFTYEEAMQNQLDQTIERKGTGDLDALIRGKNTWTVE